MSWDLKHGLAVLEVESPLFEVLTEHIHNDNTNAGGLVFAAPFALIHGG